MVVAGGSGTRFGGHKQFALLAGRLVAEWSVETARCSCDGVVLVVPPGELDRCSDMALRVVAGGTSRSESVRCGLAAVPAEAAVIVVHDAARPLSRPETWAAVVAAVEGGADGAVPCLALSDTVKQLGPDGSLSTVDRSLLLAAQTPQAFRAGALRDAHAGGGEATDDAGLVEGAGGRVVSVPGDPTNLKITSPRDLSVAEHLALLLGTTAEGGLLGGAQTATASRAARP